MKSILENITNELPEIANNCRRDLELWDYAF